MSPRSYTRTHKCVFQVNLLFSRVKILNSQFIYLFYFLLEKKIFLILILYFYLLWQNIRTFIGEVMVPPATATPPPILYTLDSLLCKTSWGAWRTQSASDRRYIPPPLPRRRERPAILQIITRFWGGDTEHAPQTHFISVYISYIYMRTTTTDSTRAATAAEQKSFRRCTIYKKINLKPLHAVYYKRHLQNLRSTKQPIINKILSSLQKKISSFILS